MSRPVLLLTAIAVLAAFDVSLSRADDVTDMPQIPAQISAPASEDCPSGEHTHARAGCPLHVAWYARPSDTGHYIGYYVGGDCGWTGGSRCPWEGTWGWDYRGIAVPRRVVLYWCHGRRYQGGTGYYRTVPRPNLSTPSTP